MIVCILAEWPAGGAAGAGEALLAGGSAPRVAVEEVSGRVWVDALGLRSDRAADACCALLRAEGATRVRAGVAATPIAAHAAAALADAEGVREVPSGGDRAFLAPLPLSVLEADERLLALLEGVGIETCGALAALDREAVEVRFGGAAVRTWHFARGRDDRRLFRPPPPSAPAASLDFVDYVVTDPERLLFTANALLGSVCEALAERGAHTRRMTLSLALANGATWTRSIGTARATASRTTWLRRIRAELDRLTVPDAVAGVSVSAGATEGAAAIQGDLFDAGFATAAAVDDAVGRLLEVQGDVVVWPRASGHPLAERRVKSGDGDGDGHGDGHGHVHGPGRGHVHGDGKGEGDTGSDGGFLLSLPLTEAQANGRSGEAGLTLQLLAEPRGVAVETVVRRDHIVPVRYRDGEWQRLEVATGPERVSGGNWDVAYAREYYRCVTEEGVLVWLYRDGRNGQWYLQGWWD